MNKKRDFKRYIFLGVLILTLSLTGCAQIRDKIAATKGELVGNHFKISIFDHYGSKTLDMDGKKISVAVLKENKDSSEDEASYDSSVLEITINGRQMIQVGNTMIFAEDGLDMIEDFQMDSEIQVDSGGFLTPVDRYINDIKNKIGKEKTVILSSPKGIPIGVFQGKKVYATVPKNLPKMTRLNIDGKSLYIHRANYMILDTDIIN